MGNLADAIAKSHAKATVRARRRVASMMAPRRRRVRAKSRGKTVEEVVGGLARTVGVTAQKVNVRIKEMEGCVEYSITIQSKSD